MADLSKQERKELARQLHVQTWEDSNRKLGTVLGWAITAAWGGACAYVSVRVGKGVASSWKDDALQVALTVLAAAGPITIAWLWLRNSAWKRKAFELQAELNALRKRKPTLSRSELVEALIRRCDRILAEGRDAYKHRQSRESADEFFLAIQMRVLKPALVEHAYHKEMARFGRALEAQLIASLASGFNGMIRWLEEWRMQVASSPRDWEAFVDTTWDPDSDA